MRTMPPIKADKPPLRQNDGSLWRKDGKKTSSAACPSPRRNTAQQPPARPRSPAPAPHLGRPRSACISSPVRPDGSYENTGSGGGGAVGGGGAQLSARGTEKPRATARRSLPCSPPPGAVPHGAVPCVYSARHWGPPCLRCARHVGSDGWTESSKRRERRAGWSLSSVPSSGTRRLQISGDDRAPTSRQTHFVACSTSFWPPTRWATTTGFETSGAPST